MAQFPALDIWTDSWLADTGHLPRVDRDIYFHLMILMWRTPGCRVPNDPDWVVRRLKITENEIPALNSVIAEFCNSDGNWLKQKRLTKEYKLALNRSKKATDNAKSRWDKEKETSGRNATQHSGRNASTATTPDTVTVEESKAPLAPQGGVGNEKGFRHGRRKQRYSNRDSFQQAVEYIEARDQERGEEGGPGGPKLLS